MDERFKWTLISADDSIEDGIMIDKFARDKFLKEAEPLVDDINEFIKLSKFKKVLCIIFGTKPYI